MRKTGTKVWARTFLPAVRELIRWYQSVIEEYVFEDDTRGDNADFQSNHKNYLACPLCRAAKGFLLKAEETTLAHCTYCLWNTGGSIDIDRLLHDEYWPCISKGFKEATAKNRLARLRRWERKLLKIIEG